MRKRSNIYGKAMTRRGVFVGVLSILAVILLVAAACGDDDTPTPVPATATPRPQATSTPVPATATPRPQATATPVPATATPVPPTPTPGPRAMSEWTVDNPATLEEIEIELEKHRGESLVFIGWGGGYQGAQRQAFFEPLREKFGIEVKEESPIQFGKLRAMVETGNLEWHVATAGTSQANQFGQAGLLEELDRSIVDIRDWPEGQTDLPWIGGGAIAWSFLTGYSTDAVEERWGGREPQTMADFFDLEKFPGRRGVFVPGGYLFALRFGLLGENPDLLNTEEGRQSLYSLTDEEYDHAFEIWDEFWPNVLWFSGFSDCPQLLATGELVFCSLDTGMLQESVREGLPIKGCWTCGQVALTDQWFVLKGIKEQDPRKFELIQLFMAWTSFPEIHVGTAKYIAYGPANLKAVPLLDDPEFDDMREFLPTAPDNLPYAVWTDEVYEGEIGDSLNERWELVVQGVE